MLCFHGGMFCSDRKQTCDLKEKFLKWNIENTASTNGRYEQRTGIVGDIVQRVNFSETFLCVRACVCECFETRVSWCVAPWGKLIQLFVKQRASSSGKIYLSGRFVRIWSEKNLCDASRDFCKIQNAGSFSLVSHPHFLHLLWVCHCYICRNDASGTSMYRGHESSRNYSYGRQFDMEEYQRASDCTVRHRVSRMPPRNHISPVVKCLLFSFNFLFWVRITTDINTKNMCQDLQTVQELSQWGDSAWRSEAHWLVILVRR